MGEKSFDTPLPLSGGQFSHEIAFGFYRFRSNMAVFGEIHTKTRKFPRIYRDFMQKRGKTHDFRIIRRVLDAFWKISQQNRLYYTKPMPFL